MAASSTRFAAAAVEEAGLAVKHRAEVLAHVGPDAFSADEQEQLEPDDWMHTSGRDNFTSAEVQVSKRCHGFHLELLRLERTPIASHYQLIHYDVPILDPKTHVLRLHGLVEREVSLSLEDLRARPAETASVLMACAGTGRTLQKRRLWAHVPWGPDAIGCAAWTGCSLADVLREAGPLPEAAQVIFTGADKGVEKGEVQYFRRSLSLDDALRGHVLLCYQMNGQDLPPAHGAPVRIIVPGRYGMASVKWLTSIEVTSGGWWGCQMQAYCFKRTVDDPGVPLRQLPVRALMAPPGCPDFVSRARLVAPGLTRVEGRAWAGAVALDRVEFSSDNGRSWRAAELGPKNGPFGWAPWHFDWEASPGTHILCCRAFDAEGRSQDGASDQTFNWGSFGSTQPQQVYVRVDAAGALDGARVDFTNEQKAAKSELRSQSNLDQESVEALYRAPGSQ